MGTVTSYTKAYLDAILGSTDGGFVTEDQLNAALALLALLQENVNNHGNTGAVYTIPDITEFTVHNVTLDEATVTFTMPTPGAGKSFVVNVKQDSIGSRLAVFTGVIWPGGASPDLTIDPDHVDELIFRCSDVGVGWRGSLGGADFTS